MATDDEGDPAEFEKNLQERIAKLEAMLDRKRTTRAQSAPLAPEERLARQQAGHATVELGELPVPKYPACAFAPETHRVPTDLALLQSCLLVVHGEMRELIIDGEPWTVRRVPAGPIHVLSGRVAVGDPGWTPSEHSRGMPVIAAPLALGLWSADLIVGRRASNDDERVAALQLQLASRTVREWRPLGFEGEVENSPTSKGAPSFGVDGGMTAVVDADLREVLHQDFETGGPIEQAVAEREQATRVHTWRWANVQVRASGSPSFNVLMTSCGWGDGSYPVYGGVDADDAVVALALEFRLWRPAP